MTKKATKRATKKRPAKGSSTTPRGEISDPVDAVDEQIVDDDTAEEPEPVVAIVAEIEAYLTKYMVLPRHVAFVIALWIVASYMADVFDRFPHLGITSPEPRCGKSRFLNLIAWIARIPKYVVNTTPAVLYRSIEKNRPTLLLDEAQSLSRRGSESTEQIREIFCGGIDRNSKAERCVGKQHEPKTFSIFSPKIVALIGQLDGVLADRCLPIEMRRKERADTVARLRERNVRPEAKEIAKRIRAWRKQNRDRVQELYDDDASIDYFDIENERIDELLLPLQAVLLVDCPDRRPELAEYAKWIDARDEAMDAASEGVQLLAACRELFGSTINWMPTSKLIERLHARKEEPWSGWRHGRGLNPELLSRLLKPYGIRPAKGPNSTATRGYFRHNFADAWSRYLPPHTPTNPVNAVNPVCEGDATGSLSRGNPVGERDPVAKKPKKQGRNRDNRVNRVLAKGGTPMPKSNGRP